MEEDKREDREKGDKDQDDREGVLITSDGEIHVHSIERSDHRRDTEDDCERCQKFNRFIKLIGEDDLVGVAETLYTTKIDGAEVF